MRKNLFSSSFLFAAKSHDRLEVPLGASPLESHSNGIAGLNELANKYGRAVGYENSKVFKVHCKAISEALKDSSTGKKNESSTDKVSSTDKDSSTGKDSSTDKKKDSSTDDKAIRNYQSSDEERIVKDDTTDSHSTDGTPINEECKDPFLFGRFRHLNLISNDFKLSTGNDFIFYIQNTISVAFDFCATDFCKGDFGEFNRRNFQGLYTLFNSENKLPFKLLCYINSCDEKLKGLRKGGSQGLGGLESRELGGLESKEVAVESKSKSKEVAEESRTQDSPDKPDENDWELVGGVADCAICDSKDFVPGNIHWQLLGKVLEASRVVWEKILIKTPEIKKRQIDMFEYFKFNVKMMDDFMKMYVAAELEVIKSWRVILGDITEVDGLKRCTSETMDKRCTVDDKKHISETSSKKLTNETSSKKHIAETSSKKHISETSSKKHITEDKIRAMHIHTLLLLHLKNSMVLLTSFVEIFHGHSRVWTYTTDFDMMMARETHEESIYCVREAHFTTVFLNYLNTALALLEEEFN